MQIIAFLVPPLRDSHGEEEGSCESHDKDPKWHFNWMDHLRNSIPAQTGGARLKRFIKFQLQEGRIEGVGVFIEFHRIVPLKL